MLVTASGQTALRTAAGAARRHPIFGFDSASRNMSALPPCDDRKTAAVPGEEQPPRLRAQPEPGAPLGHWVAKGVARISVGRVAVRLLDLVSMVVLARLLTPADFGLVAVAAVHCEQTT